MHLQVVAIGAMPWPFWPLKGVHNKFKLNLYCSCRCFLIFFCGLNCLYMTTIFLGWFSYIFLELFYNIVVISHSYNPIHTESSKQTEWNQALFCNNKLRGKKTIFYYLRMQWTLNAFHCFQSSSLNVPMPQPRK